MDEYKTAAAKVVVLGSGPIRIGRGIEFDYCSVHSVLALKSLGYESIIISQQRRCPPASTPRISCILNHSEECVLDVIQREKPEGVVVQFGGQTAINLAAPLAEVGVPILGTSVDSIDRAEDRERFLNVLEKLSIPCRPGPRSHWKTPEIAKTIGFPVLVRPSMLGGRAMEIVYNVQELTNYMTMAAKISPGTPGAHR